jgi:small-conductance mechanosensitive channel
VVLGILGFNSTGLLTLAGAVGLAFSLAIQDILKNFFSGIYLLLERPFRVGDTIRVKEQQGVVENIGVRTTELRTPENVQVLVPNAVVFAEVVTNHTHAIAVPARATDEADGHSSGSGPTESAAAASDAQKKR